jgi:hypothetical protein
MPARPAAGEATYRLMRDDRMTIAGGQTVPLDALPANGFWFDVQEVIDQQNASTLVATPAYAWKWSWGEGGSFDFTPYGREAITDVGRIRDTGGNNTTVEGLVEALKPSITAQVANTVSSIGAGGATGGGADYKLPFYINWAVYNNAVAMAGYSGSSGEPLGWSIPFNTTLLTWAQSVLVNGTNNGSNYWTVNIRDASLTVLFGSFNTSASAGSTWLNFDVNTWTNSAAVRTTHDALFLQFVKFGSPGAIFAAAPVVLAQRT